MAKAGVLAPRRIVRSGVQRVADTVLGAQMPVIELADVHDGWPATSIPFPRPHVFEPEPDDEAVMALDPNSAGRPITVPPLFVNDIPRGRIHPSGPVENERGALIIESAKRPEHLFRSEAYRRRRRGVSVVDATGMGSTIVAATRTENWFHWLTGMLPRLYALEQAGEPVELVFPAAIPRYAEQLLEMAIRPGWPVRRAARDELVQYDTVRLAGFATVWGQGYLRPELLAWLRERLLGHTTVRTGEGRRIYIRRVGTRWNAITNEEALHAELTARGFEAVRPETLTPAEQFALFAEAEVIVGPHGAGFANVFASRQATLVDIHSNGLDGSRVQISYWSLARSCGHRYILVRGAGSRYQAAFSVDVVRVCEAVELALDRSPSAPVAAVV